MVARKGKAKRLTDLELEIMQVVWDSHPEPRTVREVVERLGGGRGKRPAYTTIQTMLNILCKKGALRSEQGSGRALEYRSLLTRGEATSSMTRDFVERLFGGNAQPLFAQLLRDGSITRDELEQLKSQIETQLDDEEDGA